MTRRCDFDRVKRKLLELFAFDREASKINNVILYWLKIRKIELYFSNNLKDKKCFKSCKIQHFIQTCSTSKPCHLSQRCPCPKICNILKLKEG